MQVFFLLYLLYQCYYIVGREDDYEYYNEFKECSVKFEKMAS